MTAKLAPHALGRSAPFPDTPCHFGGQLRVGQQQLDERANNFLPGDAGESELVGGFSLPDIEGPVGGGGQVDGPSRALAAGWRLGFLMVEVPSDARDPFGACRGIGTCGRLGPKRWRAGFHADG